MEPTTRRKYWIAASLWALAALAIKPFFPYVDFGAFYATAIEKILAGTPLDLYNFAAYAPGTDLPLPLTYPPHYFYYLAPFYAVGRWLGLSDFHAQAGFSLGQAWMLLAEIPFDFLFCFETLKLVERVRGPLGERRRGVLFLALLLSPLLWLSSVRYGHNEAMMVALLLLGIRHGEDEHPIRSGLFWGLAVSLKATALVPALTYYSWALVRKSQRRAAVMGGTMAAAVFFVPLIPYLLERRAATLYALVGFESVRPIGGYVLWKLAGFPDWVVAASAPAILLAAALLGWMVARRRGDRFLDAGGAAALLVGQVVLLTLGKALFVWYGLALATLAYLVFDGDSRRERSLPLTGLSVTLLLWLLQSGPWIGAAVSPWIRLRSALWVAVLIGIAVASIRSLFQARERVAHSAPAGR